MINYQNLQDSISHYEKAGFTRVELPWCVSPKVSDMTKPASGHDYAIRHNGKVLVASAEQSFLYQYAKGYLPKGRFQAVTPCFRVETCDAMHMKHFMKNELISTVNVDVDELYFVIGSALDFFAAKLGWDGLGTVKTGDDCYDIMYHDIELGSYGIRRTEMLDWVYGTGCAEPRLSYAQDSRRNVPVVVSAPCPIKAKQATASEACAEFNSKYSKKFGIKKPSNLCGEIPLPCGPQECTLRAPTEEELESGFHATKARMQASIEQFLNSI